ncbi:hypothetical protein QS257_00155 [Terrilactibacillus sp. S3-3]|nr:hypothetical protein QS257_00155 [Terrilactibacillus sp. S3-3]
MANAYPFCNCHCAREGEIADFEWKHIDLSEGTILIEQAAIRVVGKGVLPLRPQNLDMKDLLIFPPLLWTF